MDPRIERWLATASLPISILLCWGAGIIWNEGGPDPDMGPAAFEAVAEWMKRTFPLFHSDGDPVWGWRELFWVGPAISLPAAWRLSHTHMPGQKPRTSGRVMFWALAAGTFLVGLTYLTGGPGWPFDLVSIIVATVAATVFGIRCWRRRGPLARRQAVPLALALPLAVPMTLVGMGYPSPAVFLGLLTAIAIAAWSVPADTAVPKAPGGLTAAAGR